MMRARLLPFTLALLLAATSAMAAPGSQGNTVSPSVVRPFANAGGGNNAHTFQAPLGFQVSSGHNEDLKHLGPTTQVLGGSEINLDTNTGLAPQAAQLGTNFQGMLQNGWIPYDGAIAVSGTQVLVMTNSQFAVYDKSTGAQLLISQFDPFFGAAAGGGFDPKCFYDAVANRFVMMVVEQTSTGSLALIDIAVSQTSDALGAWYKYSFDATVTGTTETNTWSDYPSLGYDTNNLYVGSNQYSFSNSFQFAKVRCWSKAQLYSGGAASYVDFANIKIADGTAAFTVKAGRNLSASATGHFLATKPGGGNLVTTWTITGTFPSLTLSAARAVAVGTYAAPPDAKQPGSGTLVATGDNRTQDVVWQNGNYYTAFAERQGAQRRTYVSAIRFLQVSDAGSAIRDVTFTASGIFMYYPAVSVDPAGNAAIAFERSSSTEYASMYQTRVPAGGPFDASKVVKAGIGANTSGRWGDYNGVANDPSNSNVVWGYGGWDNGNKWATWIAALTPSVAGAPGVVTDRAIALAGASQAVASGAGALEFASPSPNPTTGNSLLTFTLPRATTVRLAIYDLRGRQLATLVSGEMPAGSQSVTWSGRTASGARVSPGVYFARIEAMGQAVERRILIQ